MTQRFAPAVAAWRERLGTLQDVVRQELVTRQLTAVLPDAPRRTVASIVASAGRRPPT